jgi:hypothetical protein
VANPREEVRWRFAWVNGFVKPVFYAPRRNSTWSRRISAAHVFNDHGEAQIQAWHVRGRIAPLELALGLAKMFYPDDERPLTATLAKRIAPIRSAAARA